MTETAQLLTDYARNGSDDAFRELVSRYLSLVYSTALRLTSSDAPSAEDIAQTVFIDLARKAHALPSDVMLGGWLHRHTCFVAGKTMRAERRRQWREKSFVEMNLEHSPDLAAAAPVLDEAINQLGAADRQAILLRFFEQRDFRAVGAVLGIGEDAARMRVNRALDKLHFVLRKRGVTSSVTALGFALTTGAINAAPTGLAATISGVALSGVAVSVSSGSLLTTLKVMASTNLKLALGALALAGVTTALLLQHAAQQKLREENDDLRSRVAALQSTNTALVTAADRFKSRASTLSAQLTSQAQEAASANTPRSNAWVRFQNSTPRLTPAQAEQYLKQTGRKGPNLLAAYRTSGDAAYLEEAMTNFPLGAQVAFEAAMSTDLSNEERANWAKALESSDPNNSVANYLSAAYDFSSGQTNDALQELTGANGKHYQDYEKNRVQDDVDAYLAAGYSSDDAETAASMSLVLGQLSTLKQLGQSLVSLSSAYSQSGDTASAQAALQAAITMGQSLQNESTGMDLVTPLVGIAVQKMAFSAMDPNSSYGDNGQSVQEQLDQLTQTRQSMQALNQQVQPLMPNLSEDQLADYTNRRMLFGESAAMQWLVNNYGKH